MGSLKFVRTLVCGLAACGLLCAAPGAGADPTVVKKGEATLPTSGLRIVLPPRDGVVYHVSGSWALTNDGGTFDTRDVVDELDASSSRVIAGNWVLVGYFDAGGCNEVLATQALDNAWTTDTTLWGQAWKVRGGVFTFDNGLGRRPAAMLCRTNAASQSLLLYRFLTSEAETLSQQGVMADVAKASALELASRAYDNGTTADIKPLRRTDVRNRGSISAQRQVTLKKSGLTVALPDDGHVWLAREADESDMLDRMMPSLPDVSIEVIVAKDTTCEKILPLLAEGQTLGAPGRNAPAGWMLGPTLALGDDSSEAIVCYPAGYGALLAGVITPPGVTDFGAFREVLAALAGGSRTP